VHTKMALFPNARIAQGVPTFFDDVILTAVEALFLVVFYLDFLPFRFHFNFVK